MTIFYYSIFYYVSCTIYIISQIYIINTHTYTFLLKLSLVLPPSSMLPEIRLKLKYIYK